MYGISNSICFDVFRRVLHFLFIGAFFIVAISCGAKYIGTAENGVPIPNEFVRPETYLTNFPLNKFTESDLIDAFGMPHNKHEFDDKTYIVYFVAQGITGKMDAVRYTYVTDSSEMVIDVKYGKPGAYSKRLTAKKLQGVKQ